jgi:hypothetical protein
MLKTITCLGLFIPLLLFLPPPAARAGFNELLQPERSGLALTMGHSYDPNPTFGFAQLTGVAQYDYDRVWPHRAPEPLRFKLESSLGFASFRGKRRLFVSVNMLAQYYLAPATARFRPYLEGGIGLIYSDFRVDGQGLRGNFNPQAGIGCDYLDSNGKLYFANIRPHHLSNGDLNHDNRGINSVLVQFGRYF